MANLGSFIQVTDIRGKLGGNVFTKARNGSTLRIKVKPGNPRSASQTTVRSLMTSGARAAKALSGANHTLWVTYAATQVQHNRVTGAAFSPSWITALLKLYVPFFLADPTGTFPNPPPAAPYVGDVITLTAAGGSASITVTGSAQQTTGETTMLYLQPLKSANRKPSSKPGKLVSVIPVPATPFHIVLSSLAAGSYSLAYRFELLATGQQSGLVVLGTFVVT